MDPVTSARRSRGAGDPSHDPLTPGRRIAELQRLDAMRPGERWFLPLGAALRDSGRTKEALVVIRQGLSRDPECLAGWVVLGQCYLALDELAAATRVLSSVLRRDRENTVALRALAIIHARRGERDQAATHYRALLKLVPRDLAAQEALAALLEPAWGDEAIGGSGAAPALAGANGDLHAQYQDVARGGAPARATAGAPAGKPAPPARAKRKSRFDPRTREPAPLRVPRGAAPMLPPEPPPRGGIFEAPPHDLDWERKVHDLRDERRASAPPAPRAPHTPRPAGPARAPRAAPARREPGRRETGRREPAPGRQPQPRPAPTSPERAGAITGYRRWLERMIEESGDRPGKRAAEGSPQPGTGEG